MLVLARKRGQSIMIGDGIEVKILKVDGSYVSVGVDAPRDISINRSELMNGDVEDELESADDAS